MLGRLTVTTPPTGYPVTLDMVKSHTRILTDDDDALLTLYLSSATALVEAFLNRAILTQTLTWAFAETFPSNPWPLVPAPVLILPLAMQWSFTHLLRRDVQLPRSPVQGVNTVSFALWGDDAPTVLTVGDDYDVDINCDPGRVRLHSDVPWSNREFVAIEYVAGYGTAVPPPVLHAILLTTAWMWEHRGDVDVGDLPPAARSLLWNYRLATFW